MEKPSVLDVCEALESINLIDPSLFDQLAGLVFEVDAVLSADDSLVFEKKDQLNQSAVSIQKRLMVL